MAKAKSTTDKTKAKPTVSAATQYRYTGPPYPRVKLEGVPTFVPATISQAEIATLMGRHPKELERFFAINTRVKPGIDAQEKAQQDQEE